MKKLTIVGILLFGLAISAGAQEVREKKTERITLVKSDPSAEKTTKTDSKTNPTKEEQIASCEAVIKAITEKETWIKSNPEELKLAIENGWFEEADSTRLALKNKIQELKK